MRQSFLFDECNHISGSDLRKSSENVCLLKLRNEWEAAVCGTGWSFGSVVGSMFYYIIRSMADPAISAVD